jgi:hypothetical protein
MAAASVAVAQGMEKPNVAPGPSLAIAPQLSLMALDYRTADCQTDAQATRFARVERFEKLVDAARIQSDAGVLNEQFDAVAGMDLRLNPEGPRPVLDAGHDIRRIQQQVQDYLLQLYAITDDSRQRLCEVCLQYRVAPS